MFLTTPTCLDDELRSVQKCGIDWESNYHKLQGRYHYTIIPPIKTKSTYHRAVVTAAVNSASGTVIVIVFHPDLEWIK